MKYTLLILLPIFFIAVMHGETRHEGKIDEAFYIVDVPDEPNGNVMFIARGFRPSFFPLSAVYEVDTDFYQTLLAEGWIIASTSFRTNGWVVEKGGLDIIALRDHIAKSIHPIDFSVVYGETMGGGVAIWLGENHPEFFQGILGLGAHLFPEPGNGEMESDTLAPVFNKDPKIPVLFLANAGEIASSSAYASSVNDGDLKPVTWSVDRPGHVNVNSAERLAAFRALIAWTEGEVPDSTAEAKIDRSPESIAASSSKVAAGNIRRIRPLYGNLYSNLVAKDLKKLGISLGDKFTFIHGSESYDIEYAKAYSDVEIGAWVAFIDPEGYVQISRNYANAGETLGATKGDPILIKK
ncbi:MAG: SAM hydroxide adenosyltransferase [Verrucomicrobiota bacterium]